MTDVDRMADIVELIVKDHEWFRRQFTELDELRARSNVDESAVRDVWEPLAARLDVHAIAEEEIFYPQLLRVGEDAEAETLDAIGDHNDIRDGVHDAARHPIGTAQWWQAVHRARVANDEHMAEEERDGLVDFRANAPAGLRESLGARFAAFLNSHPSTRGLDTTDKDPEEYVQDVEREIDPPDETAGGGDTSLGIGGLKER